MDLNNESKHQQFTPQTRIQQRGINLTAGNQTLITRGINIHPGGKFIVNGKEVPLGEYNADNLPPIAPPASAEVATWHSFHFSSNDAKVLPFIKEAVERIDSIVNNLAML